MLTKLTSAQTVFLPHPVINNNVVVTLLPHSKWHTVALNECPDNDVTLDDDTKEVIILKRTAK